MASYIVMEPPADTEAAAVSGAVLIRDGFSFPAFAISPLWLLWQRLWIEAGLIFVAGIVIVELADQAGLGMAGTALSLLLSIFVGLEGQRLRASALRRRGWHEWGTVDAGSEIDAEARYVAAVADDESQQQEAAPAVGAITQPSARSGAGPALGLLSYPGRS